MGFHVSCRIFLGLFFLLQLSEAGEKAPEKLALFMQKNVERLIEKILSQVQEYYHEIKAAAKCIPESVPDFIMQTIKSSIDCVSENENDYALGKINSKAHKRNFLDCFAQAKAEINETMSAIDPEEDFCPENVTEKTYQINVTTTFVKTFQISISNGLEVTHKEIDFSKDSCENKNKGIDENENGDGMENGQSSFEGFTKIDDIYDSMVEGSHHVAPNPILDVNDDLNILSFNKETAESNLGIPKPILHHEIDNYPGDVYTDPFQEVDSPLEYISAENGEFNTHTYPGMSHGKPGHYPASTPDDVDIPLGYTSVENGEFITHTYPGMSHGKPGNYPASTPDDVDVPLGYTSVENGEFITHTYSGMSHGEPEHNFESEEEKNKEDETSPEEDSLDEYSFDYDGPEESEESEENEESKESKESEENEESKENEESVESVESEENEESKESKESEKSKESKESEKRKESEESKENVESEETNYNDYIEEDVPDSGDVDSAEEKIPPDAKNKTEQIEGEKNKTQQIEGEKNNKTEQIEGENYLRSESGEDDGEEKETSPNIGKKTLASDVYTGFRKLHEEDDDYFDLKNGGKINFERNYEEPEQGEANVRKEKRKWRSENQKNFKTIT